MVIPYRNKKTVPNKRMHSDKSFARSSLCFLLPVMHDGYAPFIGITS